MHFAMTFSLTVHQTDCMQWLMRYLRPVGCLIHTRISVYCSNSAEGKVEGKVEGKPKASGMNCAMTFFSDSTPTMVYTKLIACNGWDIFGQWDV